MGGALDMGWPYVSCQIEELIMLNVPVSYSLSCRMLNLRNDYFHYFLALISCHYSLYSTRTRTTVRVYGYQFVGISNGRNARIGRPN